MTKTKIFALGFFDGVHRGHQMLLAECRALARYMEATPAAITFDRHPQSLFLPQPPALINTNGDRQQILTRFGIRSIRQIAVTPENMGRSWQDFLQELLEEGTVGFVCGDDFRFGHKGEGTAETLRAFCLERGLPCIIVPEQTQDGARISSTHIRNLIERGDMETAAHFLGHPHVLTGEVVRGKQLGRTLGIPTANLHLPEGIVCPAFGVYACRALVDGKYYLAVTNVGVRPTVSGQGITIEPWILDFSGDLYGQEISLEFHHFLRPEQKFPSLAELKSAIEENAAQTRQLLE